MPIYPSMYGRGPVVLTFLEEQRILVACGSAGMEDKSCFQLSPYRPWAGWEEMPNLVNRHCPYLDSTRGINIPDLGWLVMGQENGRCNHYTDAAISSELLTSQQLQWIQTPIESPYTNAGFPFRTCSVAINSSTVITTGGWNGDYLSSTWMLDLTDYTWTELQSMPGPVGSHGCTVTSSGELIIAGGTGTSVYIYNLINNTWRRAGDLPNPRTSFNPVMLLWNKQPILLEALSSNIWIRDDGTSNWNKMEATMGADFKGAAMDLATAVPAELFTC